jgi:hypothetical protein
MVDYGTDRPVYNWARPGLGNVGIMNRIAECDLKYTFTHKDAIIVQWSSWTREDRYILPVGWQAYGNVFNNHFYDTKFIEKYWSWENDIIKNATAIHLINKTYRLAYQFNMIPFFEPEGIFQDLSDPKQLAKIEEIKNLYKEHLPEIDTWPNHLNTHFEDNTEDKHPDIRTHLHFFNNYIKPRFELNLGNVEIGLRELQNKISSTISIPQGYHKNQDTILELTKEFDGDFDFETKGF